MSGQHSVDAILFKDVHPLVHAARRTAVKPDGQRRLMQNDDSGPHRLVTLRRFAASPKVRLRLAARLVSVEENELQNRNAPRKSATRPVAEAVGKLPS